MLDETFVNHLLQVFGAFHKPGIDWRLEMQILYAEVGVTTAVHNSITGVCQ